MHRHRRPAASDTTAGRGGGLKPAAATRRDVAAIVAGLRCATVERRWQQNGEAGARRDPPVESQQTAKIERSPRKNPLRRDSIIDRYGV